MGKAYRLAETHVVAAVKRIFIVSDAVQLHFAAAISTDEKSRQRMRIARSGFSALRDRLFTFAYSIPKLLRDDGLVCIIDDNPFALVFLKSLVVLIRYGRGH